MLNGEWCDIVNFWGSMGIRKDNIYNASTPVHTENFGCPDKPKAII